MRLATGETMPQRERSRPAAANRRGPLALTVQFLRYAGCAGFAALVNFVAGSLLVNGCGLVSAWQFPLAVAVAYAVGMLVNFALNRRLTFESDRRGIDQARTFILVALSGLVLTTGVAALSRSALAAGAVALDLAPGPPASPETLSRAVAIAAVSLYSFVAHKKLTFDRGIRPPLRRLVRSLQFGG